MKRLYQTEKWFREKMNENRHKLVAASKFARSGFERSPILIKAHLVFFRGGGGRGYIGRWSDLGRRGLKEQRVRRPISSSGVGAEKLSEEHVPALCS